MRFGLFGFSDFRKLVFLDHRNFGEFSQNLHFYCSLRYNFAKFSLKVKFFLNEFEFFLEILQLFHVSKIFGAFGTDNWFFGTIFAQNFGLFRLQGHIPPPNFWQVTPPIEALINIYIRTRYWGSDRPKGGVIKIEK